MTNLDRLIKELCPNGVKFESLGKIAVRTKGTPITAAQMKELDKPNAPIKIFAGGKTVAYFDYSDLPEKDINTYPSVIVKSRGVVEFEYYDKPFSHKNEMWSYHSERDDVDIKYLYYFLKIQESKLREKAASMGAFPQIAIPDTERLLIPLPPLPIQREIVRILDNFTELTAELTARKKQYEYYRNALFCFDSDVDLINLEELANIGTGSKNTVDGLQKGEYPFYVRSQEVRYLDSYEFDETAIITSGDGVGVGKIFHFIEGKYALHQRAYRINIFDKRLLPKFFYYYMSTTFYDYISKNAYHASVTSIRRPMLNNYPVPVPSIKEQARIIAILDKFDTLTTDISVGLPAEIEARTKQYEYYRNKLLTFEEAMA